MRSCFSRLYIGFFLDLLQVVAAAEAASGVFLFCEWIVFLLQRFCTKSCIVVRVCVQSWKAAKYPAGGRTFGRWYPGGFAISL